MKRSCDFCWRCCQIEEEQVGFCQMRKNEGGKLVTLYYGSLVGLSVDPVEKKPLYHFLPGTSTLSLAMFGCNLTCSFCQNYTISQSRYRSDSVRPPTKAGELVSLALRSGCPSISFTYSEPLVWQDYLIEVAIAAKEANLKTIMVSNGTFSTASLERLVPLIDAFNIDLKGDEFFYQRFCKGSAKPVVEALRYLCQKEVHLEVTTMVMQGEHTLEDVLAIGALLQEMGVHIWHLSRYFPNYKTHLEATKDSFLKEILQAVQETSIAHVYGGNSILNQNTYCPFCNKLLIRRDGRLSMSEISFVQGTCQVCGHKIYGCFPS